MVHWRTPPNIFRRMNSNFIKFPAENGKNKTHSNKCFKITITIIPKSDTIKNKTMFKNIS